ncbi:sensor histidine kinase [Treponema zioleckii]|uniref:sensor histidine kinase n=1 Tax=Treponema zioleckii TaxID=331680 RepID=UPI00168A401B|nr:HAMP domain-containing sensor histidine kinase [Treponema zioleckii]
MKKAIKHSFALTFAFLILFMNLFFLMRISLRDTQAKKLEGTTAELFAQINDGNFSNLQTSQKDVDFVIYALKSKKILAANRDFLPLLPLAKGIQRYSLKNPKNTEKKIEILYLCRNYELSGGKIVCIQVSVPTEKELPQKLLALIPRSILKILIPLILILFFALAFYFLRLEKKYDTQKEFIANVSHELKTPVAVISGHADLLRRHGKKLLEKNESEFEKSVTLISKESEKMTKIILNLLELTRLENRLTKPKKEEIIVQDFFEEIRAENEKNILIEIEPFPKKLAISSDRNLLSQIFSIAIENSKKHAETENLKISLCAEKSGRKTALTIRDNGKGFSKEALSHAFDRFFSGDKSHKKGSGIGLSIAKSIARVLGAKLRLENDRGAVVKILV